MRKIKPSSIGIVIAFWLSNAPALADMMVPMMPTLLKLENQQSVAAMALLFIAVIVVEATVLSQKFGFGLPEAFKCAFWTNLLSSVIGFIIVIVMGPEGKSYKPPLFVTWEEALFLFCSACFWISLMTIMSNWHFRKNSDYFLHLKISLRQLLAVVVSSLIFFNVAANGLGRALLNNSGGRGAGQMAVSPWLILLLFPSCVMTIFIEYATVAKYCSSRNIDCNRGFIITAIMNIVSYGLVMVPAILLHREMMIR